MGEQRVALTDAATARRFIEALLTDLRALEAMIERGLIESDVRRIGAEQELFLVDRRWRPAPRNMEVLERLDDPSFTTELGRFNLEVNLPPLRYGGDCLARLHAAVEAKLEALRPVVEEMGIGFLLTGILPTLRASDIGIDNMTPVERYRALDEALRYRGGGRYQLRLKGMDELFLEADSCMLEACCTSFQAHLQVGAGEFATVYNVAQVAAAPVLAAAVNSPLLFGRRLWRETRVPLFQQSIDTRDATYHLRERRPRVGFGSRWVEESVLELFRYDIGRFRALVAPVDPPDPFAALARGEAPELAALQVYNGTVYRWNRPCYGVLDGRGHLRIEMRALPSGPTVADEIANTAFYLGLVDGLRDEYGDVRRRMEFHVARTNFSAAAELGLDAQIRWLDGRPVPAQRLICDTLLPVARAGLRDAGIDAADVDRYLGIIEERVASGRTGAQWMLGCCSRLAEQGTRDEILTALTAAVAHRQSEGQPGHWWSWAELEEGFTVAPEKTRVEEFMSTDLHTVDPDEPVELVAHVMEWRRVRHVPVEDREGRLVGMVSCFDVLGQFSRAADRDASVPVREIMQAEPVTVSPETSMSDAVRLLRRKEVTSLAVVKDGRLVGIVTEHDFVHIVDRLLAAPGEAAEVGEEAG